MEYMLMILFAIGIAVVDQITKWLVVLYIPYSGQVPVVPGLLHLTFVRNTGAAFSVFQGMQWLFLLIFVLFAIGIVWEFSKKRWPLTMFERWCVIAIFGGGLGNMLDRLRMGYVVDMIEVEFINFPVFNVADCFITCGCILLMVHLAFFNKAFWKDGRK